MPVNSALMSAYHFKHLETVKSALKALHSKIVASDIQPNWPSFVLPALYLPYQSDEIIYIQKVAAAVAAHYRLTRKAFVVSFNSAIDSAASVEVSRADEIFIEYNHPGQISILDLWPTMAHEIAHIFLKEIGVEFDGTFENEVLTDTATIYLGFGAQYLSAQRKELTAITKEGTTYTTKRLGYISPAEMGYVLAIRDYLTGECSLSNVSSRIGQDGYKQGKARFWKEKGQRPFRKRGVLNRMIFGLGWHRTGGRNGIVFRCYICKQTIRVPALHKEIYVKCPNCGEKIHCFA